MKKILTLIIVMILSITTTACTSTNNSQLSKDEKIEDFEYMFRVIEEGYPYLEVNKRMNNIDWVGNKDKYLKRIENTKNDDEFLKELTSIVSDLNNGHTHIVNDKRLFEFFYEALGDMGWYDFWEDEKVISRYENMESKGKNTKKPMEKKDVIARDVIDGKVAYMHLPQMYGNQEDIQKDMEIFDEYIKTLENHQTLIIDIRGNSGGSDLYWDSLVRKLTQQYIETTGYMLYRSENDVVKQYIKSRSINAREVEGLPEEILENAPKEVKSSFSTFSVKKLGIGSGSSLEFQGKVYLLVDKVVYSSAESFSIFCKNTGFATIVGEITGGDGGGIDPILFNLENSGIIVRMSSDMYLTQEGICNEEFKTTPDYIVKDVERTKKFEDDKCIQKVLELEGIK